MQIYNYDPVTRAYTGTAPADPSPLEGAGHWLIPAHATEIAPPEPVAGTLRVFVDGAWRYEGIPAPRPPPMPEPPSITKLIDTERDRRISDAFQFRGKFYQLDDRSVARVTAMAADARFALLVGAQVGNLRWADPMADFGWIATDNSITPMDAHDMAAFADKAKLWVARHTFAARALKNETPIPANFSDDIHWPALEN